MDAAIEKKMEKIRFTFAKPGADRVYHVTPEQIKVVLSRLPYELWRMIRDVHFNDRSRAL